MKRLLCALLIAGSLGAAEPDWAKWNSYATDLLQRYVRIASINPPANTRETAALIKGEFEKHGFAVTLYPSGPAGQTNLLLRLKGRDSAKKPLLLLNHMDVVPVDRKAWGVDPFGGILKDGFLWGRGALDMKGIGVEQMVALMALKEAGQVPARDVVMLCTADEESGGEFGIKWMIANHRSEIDAEYLLDEGGLGTPDVLAAGKLVFGVAVGEKQLMWLRLRAKGTAGHGSQPIADNANMILLQAIQKALDLPASNRANAVVGEMKKNVGPFADNKFTSAIQRNTMSLTTLTSGVGSPVKPNVIPSAAEATLDCRLLPGTNADEFLSDIKARINDPHVTVELINKSEDAGASSSGTPLFFALSAAIKAQYPASFVTPMLIPYGTDGVFLRKQGVKAYGVNPMVIDSKIMATFHSDEERIPVDSFLKGIRIFYDVLRADF